MFDVICVSSRKNSGDFFKSLETVAQSGIKYIILREKDLSEEEYFELAKVALKICEAHGAELIIHNFINVARKLKIKKLHLPYSLFVENYDLCNEFELVGTSVHNTSDAVFAEKHGAGYITAGHIFATDCKKGLAPRGVEFLRDVCESVSIPVYAIGGINAENAGELAKIKAENFSGVCAMSGLMKSDNPTELVNRIKGSYSMQKKNDKNKYLLYAVTDRRWLNGRELCDVLEEALRGGVTLVQLREKNLSFDDFCKEAQQVHKLCKSYNVPLIINDNTEVAKAVNAEGVHLGQGDLSPALARKILGENAIIGVTARTVEQAVKAQNDGADYIGSGAVFGTSTKSDAVKMSIETLNAICNAVDIPVTAIGGITKDNILELMGAEISGAAVVSGIFAEDDILNSCKELRMKIEVITRG